MKLIDDLYSMYRHMLTGDEEDADIIVFSVLETLNRNDLLELIKDMNEQELYSMMGIYMLETFKGKMAQDSLNHNQISNGVEPRNVH